MNNSIENSTDCRTEEGIEVGLIDGIIAMARSIRRNHKDSLGVREAMKDLQADEDVKWLLINQ